MPSTDIHISETRDRRMLTSRKHNLKNVAKWRRRFLIEERVQALKRLGLLPDYRGS